MDRRRGPGFVYLLEAADGWYHIGRTANPDQRFGGYWCRSMRQEPELKLVSVYAVPHQKTAERQLHEAFEYCRCERAHSKGKRKEWFRFSPGGVDCFDVECFKAECEQIEESIKMPTHWWWPDLTQKASEMGAKKRMSRRPIGRPPIQEGQLTISHGTRLIPEDWALAREIAYAKGERSLSAGIREIVSFYRLFHPELECEEA